MDAFDVRNSCCYRLLHGSVLLTVEAMVVGVDRTLYSCGGTEVVENKKKKMKNNFTHVCRCFAQYVKWTFHFYFLFERHNCRYNDGLKVF